MLLDHLSIQCVNVPASAAFFDAVLAPLGATRIMDFGEVIGYGSEHRPYFWIGPATTGGDAREAHIAFSAPDRDAVVAFFDAAVLAGAEVLHEPRVWPEYHPNYFGAFVRDPDGNNVEAVCHAPAQMERADVVVVGGGLLGLATARALRDRREVVVLEAASVGHARGGSHGPSRIFRLGYDDELYVRMAMQARAAWHDLEREAGVHILHPTGQLTFGGGRRALFDALTACGASVEFLPAAEVQERFPMFAGHGAAVFEPESAVVAADRVLDALQATARCEVRAPVRVTRLDDRGRSVVVETDSGAIEARRVVVCAGAGTSQLTPIATTATLEHVAYVSPRRPETPAPPIFIAYDEPPVYGLPTPGSDRYKIALHHAGAAVDVDHDAFVPDERAVAALLDATRRWLPGYDAGTASIDVCPYDNTPDEDFVLDRIGNVVIGAGTSGHGFKFGPLLGAVLAALVCDDAPAVPLDRFSAYRLRHGEP